MKGTENTRSVQHIADARLEDLEAARPEQTEGQQAAGGQGQLKEEAFQQSSAKAYFQQKLGIKPEDVREVADAGGGPGQGTAQPRSGQRLPVFGRGPEGPHHPEVTMQDVKDLKASYEAARDVLDVTQGARSATQEQLAKAEKAIGAFRGTLTKTLANNSKELQVIQEEARGIARQVADNKMPLGKARQALAGLQARQSKVLSEIGECEKLAGKLEQVVHAGGKFNKGVTQVSEMGQELKLCKGNLGKVMFGLDAACNFADLQGRDPSNTEKNVKQAVMMSAAKFLADIKTSGTRANMVETAVGLLKFGIWSLGMSDTPAGKSVDALASVLPIEMFSKNVGMLVDINETIRKDLATGGGALKDWERINSDNLAGTNGPWVQTGAMIGDLCATGGANLPTRDMYGLGESLGIYGVADSVPDQFKRANNNAKARAIDELLNSNAGIITQHASNENSLKVRELLSYGPPAQTVDLLKRIDKNKLVNQLNGNVTPGVLRQGPATTGPRLPVEGHLTNPAGLVVDLIHKANSPLTPPHIRTELMGQVAQIVHAAAENGKKTTIGQLQELLSKHRLGDIPNSLRNTIRDAAL